MIKSRTTVFKQVIEILEMKEVARFTPDEAVYVRKIVVPVLMGEFGKHKEPVTKFVVTHDKERFTTILPFYDHEKGWFYTKTGNAEFGDVPMPNRLSEGYLEGARIAAEEDREHRELVDNDQDSIDILDI